MDATASPEEEYRGADDVVLKLVALEVRRAAADPAPPASGALELAPVAIVLDGGMRRVIRWQMGHTSALGLVARQAVAEARALRACASGFPRWPLNSSGHGVLPFARGMTCSGAWSGCGGGGDAAAAVMAA
ncbi:hypothetical protein [Puerhibacterium sp. TATVAM-FAB25]|uniref:hypothetical protein n=1 Tax=Puerhibacterium sp. TATVAM-FAB25 TaxID=3093699 RepID=UPI00397D5C4A